MLHSKIAVLITCYNRKETTLACLTSLYRQKIPNDISFDVYLVDDGSVDGTADAIKQQFPDVKIIRGTGSLYWCGGMRLAWSEASKSSYDFYLWLNDDTTLLPNAIETLVTTAKLNKENKLVDSIIVGSCRDPKTGKHSYGGSLLNDIRLIKPSGIPQECELINGNIVLVPDSIFQTIGNLSHEFAHTSGDNDYGLRAIKNGFKNLIAPGYQGLCARNENQEQWADHNIPLRGRLKILHSVKGQPFREIYIFARRHRGYKWPFDIIKLYTRVFFPRLYIKAKSIFSKIL